MATAVIGALRVMLDLGTAGWTAGLSKAEVQADKFASKFAGVGTKVRNTGIALSAAITAPFALFARQALQAASDAGELNSAFDMTFGEMAGSMSKWAEETGNAMGRSTREIKEGANAFGLYFNQAAKTREEAAKMSQSFTVLAQDLASFHNTSVDDALLALRSGLSGETEPLRRFGVFLNEAAVKAKALEMGMKPVGKEFTDQQKIMARSAIILEKTATAQGDVIRTSDSSANRVRAAKAAWEELQITVGEKLIPSLTPLLGTLNDLLIRFNQLDPSVQSFIVGAGVVAAVLGPLLTVLGPLIGFVGAFGASLAASAVEAGGWAPVLAPILPVLLAIAAAAGAAYVVWKNWDTIGPILSGAWDAISSTLGPPLMNLLEAAKAAVLALWESAFVQGIVKALGYIGQFQMAALEAFGSALPGVLKALGSLFGGVINMIADALRFVVSILSGDWQGAWAAAQSFVKHFGETVRGIFGGLVEAVVGYVSSMVRSIDEWLGGGLERAWQKVKAGVDKVKGWFFGMYDAVVGHSYVPDMVDEIAAQFVRLDSVMVGKSKEATGKTSELFRKLADEVRPLLDRLFPEATALLTYRRELKLLDDALKANMITLAQHAEARSRLFFEAGGVDPKEDIPIKALEDGSDPLVDPRQVEESMEDVTKAIDRSLFDPLKDRTAEAIENFAGMARDVLGSLRGMVQAFKGGDILGGITQLFDLIVNVVGLIRGGTPAPSVNVNGGGYGGGRAMGGPVVAGKSYRVGERGPEWFTPATGGVITPNGGGGGGNVYHISGNLLTPEFWAQIQGMSDEAAQRGAMGGAHLAAENSQRAARYSIGGRR